MARRSRGDCEVEAFCGFRQERHAEGRRRFESGMGVNFWGFARRGSAGKWLHLKCEGLASSKRVIGMVMELR